MDARDKQDPPQVPGAQQADSEATVTFTLSAQAAGALEAYLRSGAARGLAFEPALRQALGSAGGLASARARRNPLSARTLRKVHEFVEANLGRDIRVADIAAAAFLSPCHLGHGYREATGESLWQYVLRRRAEYARSLIDSQPQCTLAEVAAQCGFESYGQFIAAFRKTHGLVPGDYRRLRAAMQEST
ncbi:helix-turn-helix transcriptional regulator [Ramlibacter sp. AN1133]|uniref:helix-turn-helix transcriptional regulator n=1 Tax=Ramlibacter sp. AN1133 TaxID=3133429 RepID=UPI0030C12E16